MSWLVVLPPMSGPAHGQDLLLARFRGYLESLRTQASIPGLAAAIVGPREIVWEHAFGWQDIEQAVATRTDTPFHIDGLTQLFSATMVLRCVEEGELALDDLVASYDPDADADLTIGQVLTHTSGSADDPDFSYRPERYRSLAAAIEACQDRSFLAAVMDWLDELAMFDSVPGAGIVDLDPPDGPTRAVRDRYEGVLERLATPYAIDGRGRASPSDHPTAPATPDAGVISTVLDLAEFTSGLQRGLLLRNGTLDDAWQAPVASDGDPLPHGLGWFVQTYNGETIAWQFGVSNNASSSLLVVVPERGISLVLLANSSGLTKSFELASGDLRSSPFGRLFLEMFVR